MATQQIEFEAPSGLTLVAKLFTKSSDSVAYTASSVTEATNRKGIYTATFSNVSDNLYQLIATSGTTGVASWWGYVKNNNLTYQFGQHIYAGNVWDVDHSQHMVANTFGKLIDIIHKANLVIEGTVTNAITPTTTQFSSDVNYPTGALEHAVLLWVNGSSLSEQNSPILTYVNTNGVITVEEAFTSAPNVGDTFVVIPGNHVHAVADIALGIRSELATELARIDVAISSVSGDCDAGDIADAVRTELATELARIDVPISSRLDADSLPLAIPQQIIYQDNSSCDSNLTAFIGEVRTQSISLFNSDGSPFDFDGLTLRVCIENSNKTDLEVIEDANIIVSGNIVSFETSLANTSVGQHYWSLRSIPDDLVLAHGNYNVRKAALASN